MNNRFCDFTMKEVNDSLTPSNFIEGVIVLMPPPFGINKLGKEGFQNDNPL